MTDNKVPEHEAVYLRLRDMVLFGEFAPGDPVTINGLKDKIGSGMTPIREAIRRLMAQGALESTGTRRVVVPQMTIEKFEQINFARNQIEPNLASMAAEKADKSIIKAMFEFDKKVDEAIEKGDIVSYLECNYRFHFCLYEAAHNDILCEIVHSLWLKIGPAMRIVCGKMGTANLPDMHNEALTALAGNNYAGVGDAIRHDIAQGMNHVRHSLS